MKLLFENEQASFTIEEDINEATGFASKKYKIKGIFSTPEAKNRNGRIYPLSIWEEQVAMYQKELESGSSNCLMELDHPPRSQVDMMEAVAKIEKLYIKDNIVMGEATLLNNPKANHIKSLIDAGITMAVSSRGVGKIGQNGRINEFKLITFDLIPNQGQSDYQAQMKGIVEGVLSEKEFLVTESGNIEEVQICTENACHMFDTKTVQEAVKTKFDKILSEMMVLPSKKDNSKAKTNKRQFKATFDYKNPMTNKSQKMSLYFSDKESAEKFADLNYMKILNIKED